MSRPAHNTLAAERRKARHYGMQALYQWYMAGASLSDIEAEFRADYDFSHVDLEYFQALLHGTVRDVAALDALYASTPECGVAERPKKVPLSYQRGVFAMGLYRWWKLNREG